MSIDFNAYETVIGFECHAQLKTNSKLFSRGSNCFGQVPNALVDVVDLGLPGVLPSINEKTVEFAITLGLALGCSIRRESVFARKHYFYPDLPKGYQISQFDKPICEGGILKYFFEGEEKSIRINRIHIEEDAGKNTHSEGLDSSFVDFNRAGTPLLEIVTEPDLRSAEEAMEAFRALRQIVTHLEICDGNMQEGSIRADVNVSVRKKGDQKLGTRTETKNLNSFKFLANAIRFEARRQIIDIESGRKIVQETRLWDPKLKESRSMRSKEEAHDYRYFPDPDLLPLVVDDSQLNEIKNNMTELPHDKFLRYQNEFSLSAYDAKILTSDRQISNYFESANGYHNNPKQIANWIINYCLKNSGDSSSDDVEEAGSKFDCNVSEKSLSELVKLIDLKIISSSIGKKVFIELEKHPELSPKEIVDANQWTVINDQNEIENFVATVIENNPAEVEKYLSGKTKVFGFLMGQLMKLAKGKVNPDSASKLLRESLDQKQKSGS